ncbi:Tn3 family transposase, partial [Streptomyces sp. NPDC058231]|uniref:Tn3 family transposase n=1 Tax=Streptomyces sp. NPDC058231 TaxID=3346392 RepID=UPI0036E70EDC
SQFRHLMRVAVSVREGTISSSTLLKRLRSGSRKNATYAAFREVGRVTRTVQLLRYLSDAPMRRRVTAATNKVESFNRLSQWIGFANRGVIADNDPIEQEKAMKFNALLTNAVIFHNALDIAETVRRLLAEGWKIDPEDLAHISPYLTEHINRLGEYSKVSKGVEPIPAAAVVIVALTAATVLGLILGARAPARSVPRRRLTAHVQAETLAARHFQALLQPQ